MIEYDLKGVDESHYSEDIYEFVPLLVPVVQKFYDRFDVKISGVTYTSGWGKNDARITFNCDTNEPYCALEIDTTNISSAFAPPSKRKWHIVLHFKNISTELNNLLYNEKGLSSLNIHYCKDEYTSVEKKIDTAIDEYKDWIEEYINFVRASEMFLF